MLEEYPYPKLYKKNKRGKILEWEICVTTEINEKTGEEVPLVIRKSGQVGGKTQIKKRYVKAGVNVGKANEQSPLEYAHFLAKRWHTEKIEDNFVLSPDDVDLPPTYWYPMLAHTYEKGKNKIEGERIGQPKLNGVRLWQPRSFSADQFKVRDVTPHSLLSREMFPTTILEHIADELHIFGKYSPDGEVYKHGVPLQTINSWASKKYPETETLEYWVYDLAIPKVPTKERIQMIKEIVPANHPVIKIVPSIPFRTEAELFSLHNIWVKFGYEGAMIRTPDQEYEYNERSYNLLKFKDFIDAEYPVVGYEIEEYHDQATDEIWRLVVWICEDPETGERFTVRPTGKMEKRRVELFNPVEFFSQLYNVRFQEKSINGVPIFPTGRGFRQKELW